MSEPKKTEEAEETAATEAQESAPEAEIKDPAAEIEGLKAALSRQHEDLLRAVAEADNVRRRAQREVSEAYGRGQRQIVRELLACLDSLELGLGSSETATADSLLEGQRATLRLMQKTLEQFSVEAVDPQGEPFDPQRHEAVSMQPSDSVDAECVISVMQRGYLMQGRLLRAARVVVCSGPPAVEETDTGQDL